MKLGEIQDERILKILHLLVSMGAPASNTNTGLMLMVLMRLVCISREHGNSVFSPVVYAGYGLLCNSVLDKGDDVKDIVTLVEALMDRYNDPSINCIAHFTLGAFCNTLGLSATEGYRTFRKGYKKWCRFRKCIICILFNHIKNSTCLF